MSLHISAISIQGDARTSMEGFFAQCGYRLLGPLESISGWSNLGAALRRPEDKAVAYHDSRTVIIDPELVIMLDEGPLKELSKQYGSVVTMVSEGVSATYGFALYQRGEKIRSLTTSDGEVVEQSGTPLAEEAGADPAPLSEDRVLDLIARLGFDYFGLEKASEFNVYHLEFPNAASVPAADPRPEANRAGGKKPWWKVW